MARAVAMCCSNAKKSPKSAYIPFLLGNLYSKTGLPRLAAESLDEAQFLMSREGK